MADGRVSLGRWLHAVGTRSVLLLAPYLPALLMNTRRAATAAIEAYVVLSRLSLPTSPSSPSR